MTLPDFREFPNTDLLTDALSEAIVRRLKEAAERKDAASFVAAGGTTVPRLYKKLASMEAPWSRTSIVLSDERWVDLRDTASNERLVRDQLLVAKASSARLISMRGDSGTPEAAIATAHKELAELPMPFDVTLLGMGADMHVGSLFPDAKGLDIGLNADAPDLVCKIGPVESAAGSQTRLSLTLGAILSSRIIYLMIVGEKKRAAYEKALSHDDPTLAPASALFYQDRAPVQVFWAP